MRDPCYYVCCAPAQLSESRVLMKPTIKSIAEYAGVSRGTVDRVLHGRPNVNPQKRRRVEDALKKLHYSPNAAARALALKTKNIKIAALMPRWIGSFETEVARGIESASRELADYGLDIVVKRCETELAEECVDAIDALLAEGVRGLAVCARNSEAIQRKLLALSQAGFPVVTFNSDIPRSGRMCFIGEDVVKSGRIAGDLMVKLLPEGGRALVVCGNHEFEGHKGRVSGFSGRCGELGIGDDRFTVIETFNDFDITHRKVLEHLERDPGTAGVYMANESVPGCVEAVRQFGGTGRIRVVCHDLSETTTRLLRCGSVDFVIEQDLFRQGFLPMSMLANLLMAGKKPEQEIEYARIQIVCAENII